MASKDDIDAFLMHEAELLDGGRFEDWLDLFAADGSYWVPLEWDQDNPEDTVSLIYDDRRALETRVRQLSSAHRHAQQPRSRTSHLIGNARLLLSDERLIRVRSNFQVTEARGDDQRLFAGHCLHTLAIDGGTLKIQLKRVNLINCDAVHDGFNVPI